MDFILKRQLFDICGATPDITALGKVIGGGLPVGAYGARDEIMQHLSPLGPVYQVAPCQGIRCNGCWSKTP